LPDVDDPRVATLHSLLPLISRSERAELRQLREAFDYFIRRLEAHPLRNAAYVMTPLIHHPLTVTHLILSNRMDAESSVDRLLSVAREEQSMYDLFFQELSRQVGVQCKERGDFLSKVID
jgi:hypothetical protein